MDSTNEPSNGAQVILTPCDGNNVNQLWNPRAKGNNQFLLQRAGTNFCLDTTGQHQNGQHTHLWECVGNANQVFQSTYVAPPAPTPPQPPTNPTPNFQTRSALVGSVATWDMERIVHEAKSKVDSNPTTWNDYSNVVQQLEGAKNLNDLFTSTGYVNSSGQFVRIAPVDYAYLIENNTLYYKGYNPNLTVVLESGEILGKLADVVDVLSVGVALTQDYQNRQAGVDDSLIPYANTYATATGIVTGKATTVLLFSNGCFGFGYAAPPWSAVGCGVVAVGAGIAVEQGIIKGGNYTAHQVLTRQNAMNTYNTAKTVYWDDPINNPLRFIRNFCFALGGNTLSCPNYNF